MWWIAKRIAKAILTMWIVITITFVLVRLMPGNPMLALYIQYVVQQQMEPERAKALIARLYNMNLDDPLYVQYIDYFSHLIRGDLGRSITRGNPVAEMIAYALPWTVFILSLGICISFVLGILWGGLMAYKGGLFDHVSSAFCTIISSTPSYIIAILLIYILHFQLNIFPAGGLYTLGITPGFTLEFISDVLWHATLPIITYVMVTAGSWALLMKGSVISVLGADYVAAAEARGLKKRKIMWSYVMRNAMLPLFTSLLISMGYIFGGSVFIENVFAYKGMGYMMITALNARDYTLMQGIFNVTTFTVVLANFIADLSYGKLDPRIRRE
ncbi:MAG: ABC transporter permease [Candidatus Bathyarchaeia archaeon]